MNWRPKNITDYAGKGLDVAVRCLRCERVAVYDAGELTVFFASRHWPQSVPIDPRRFVCRCRSKDLIVEAVPRCFRPSPLPDKEVVLQPIYVRPGRGWRTARVVADLPPELVRLWQLIVSDPTKRLAWRVQAKRRSWTAEVRCGCPWAGADPLFSGDGTSEDAALESAAMNVLSYWTASGRGR